VFHAAAYKHVPLMESHPVDAIDNNVRGTRTLAEVAEQAGVESFVMISTDKAVKPTSVMGASKRVAELVVQFMNKADGPRFTCVRFGNVLGSRGSVVHTFKRAIEDGGPVTVTHPDAERYFMTISEAVQLVIQAGAAGKGGDLFVLDMGEPVKIIDLARQMIDLAGGPEDSIPIVYTGLRPGEKMAEELIDDGEEAVESGLARILRVEPKTVDRAEFERQYEALVRASDGAEIRQVLRQVGIGYTGAPGQATSPEERDVGDARLESDEKHGGERSSTLASSGDLGRAARKA
jgi:FlaA1/EpsC-like NDP-sugar epimerase